MRNAADVEREAVRAEARIREYVRDTWLEPSPTYSGITGAAVHLKLENLQHTGSFKARGALNRILALSGSERERGVVAASTGNHGAAVAWASGVAECPCLVLVPEGAAPSKLAGIERLGGEVRFAGSDCVDAERAARAHALRYGMVYISPYNDPLVVAGQGTIALELLRRLERVDLVIASLGGGGLLSGIAGVLAVRSPQTRVYGVSPSNSRVMIESVKAGRVVELPSLPTLSDGTAGGVELGAITFELCRDLVADYVTVSEEAIAECLRGFIEVHHMLVEGSAAAVLAALCVRREELAGCTVAAIMCGGNIGVDKLARVLAGGR